MNEPAPPTADALRRLVTDDTLPAALLVGFAGQNKRRRAMMRIIDGERRMTRLTSVEMDT